MHFFGMYLYIMQNFLVKSNLFLFLKLANKNKIIQIFIITFLASLNIALEMVFNF